MSYTGRMRRTRIAKIPFTLGAFLCLVAASACGDDAQPAQQDGRTGTRDGGPAADKGAGSDAALADAPRSTADGPAPRDDSGTPADDAIRPDAGGSADGGPTDPGPVMCRRDDDCGGNGLVCLKHIPGGHCKGCGTDTSKCPAGLKCFQDICVRPCTDDSQCNAGLRCLGTSHCAGQGCAAGCPEMYPCEYPLCERAKCDQGQPCPFPMRCDGEWCMEP